MNDQFKVSIIVAVYNVEKYIHRCVDSLLCQTHHNIEVLLVDDGSIDGSAAICDEYAAKDSRVKAIHQKNGGVSSARNEGLKAAIGDWICFLDSDDWIEGDFFKLLFEAAESSSVDLTVCGIKMGEKGNYSESFCSDNDFSILSREEWLRCFTEYRNRDDRYICLHSPCGKLYKKSILDGIFFDSTMKYAEDYKFNLSVYERIERITFIKKTLYFYFSNPNSATNSFNITSAVNHFHTVDLTYEFFKQRFLPLDSADYYAYTVLKSSVFSIFINYVKTGNIDVLNFSIIKSYLKWKIILKGKKSIKDLVVLSLCKFHLYELVKLLSKMYLSGK